MSERDPHAGLRERTKAYTSRIIRLYAYLQKHHHFASAACIIGKQLLRSGTSVAANHREAKHARSRADLIAKIAIMLQELEESLLWLELLTDHQMAPADSLLQIVYETQQLIGIFTTSIDTLKKRAS